MEAQTFHTPGEGPGTALRGADAAGRGQDTRGGGPCLRHVLEAVRGRRGDSARRSAGSAAVSFSTVADLQQGQGRPSGGADAAGRGRSTRGGPRLRRVLETAMGRRGGFARRRRADLARKAPGAPPGAPPEVLPSPSARGPGLQQGQGRPSGGADAAGSGREYPGEAPASGASWRPSEAAVGALPGAPPGRCVSFSTGAGPPAGPGTALRGR